MVNLTMTSTIVEALEKIQSLERAVDEDIQLQEPGDKTQDQKDRSAPEKGSRSDEKTGDADGTDEIEKNTDSEAPGTAAKRTLEAGEPSLENPKLGSPISHGQVIDLSRKLKVQGLSPWSLDTLLRGARVYVAPPPPKSEPVSSATLTSYQTEATN